MNAAYAVHLQRASEIDYPTTPEKMGAVDSYGGVFSVTVEVAGTYAVALDSKAWIDMLEGGNVVASAAHSHGPECTTIRKVVSFELQPGPHVIQIAASANAEMAIMVLRQP
ncbi:MAG: hypothetical protein R3C52_03530 [Hyphomonadaceae bacterium]